MPSALNLPRIIGHRGAAANAPENTLASIRKAAELGARFVEVDVTISACGRAVLHHDFDLERCTNGTGFLLQKNYDELRKLDAGLWFAPEFMGERIPTLEQTLEQVKKLNLGINLEIKPTIGWEIPTTHLITKALNGIENKPPILISSFSQSVIALAQTCLPELPRALLTYAIPKDWKVRLKALGCMSLHCHWQFLTAENVAEIKAAGYKVVAFTVNTTDTAQTLFNYGVDSIITDDIDKLLKLPKR